MWPAAYVNQANMTDSYQYQFGFCQLMSDADNATCATDAFAIGSAFDATQPIADQPPSDCFPYSGSSKNDILAETISRTDADGEVQSGVSLTYSGGNACISTGQPTTFTIKAWCDSSISPTDTEYTGQITNNDPCHPEIELVSSIGGCDLLTNSPIWVYLEAAEPYLGWAALAGGFIICFYGFKLLKPSLFLGGFLSCIVLALLFCYAVYAESIEDLKSTFYYFIAGGAVAGIIVGWLLARYIKVGAAVLAGWGGFCLGLVLNEAFFFRFEYKWVFWTANILCILVCAALTFKLFDPTIIAATSFSGAYFMVRGVSCYAGHYYNEFTMVRLLQSGAIETIDPFYWCYVAGFVIFGGLGIFIQWRYRPKEKKTHPYHRS